MPMKKRVAGKVKYIGSQVPKPCCPVSDNVLNQKKEEDDERTEKKDKHTK